MVVPVVLSQSLCISLFYERSKYIYLKISPEKILKILLDFEMEILHITSVNWDEPVYICKGPIKYGILLNSLHKMYLL